MRKTWMLAGAAVLVAVTAAGTAAAAPAQKRVTAPGWQGTCSSPHSRAKWPRLTGSGPSPIHDDGLVMNAIHAPSVAQPAVRSS